MYSRGKGNVGFREGDNRPQGRTSAIWQEIPIKLGLYLVHKDKMSHNRLDKEAGRLLVIYIRGHTLTVPPHTLHKHGHILLDQCHLSVVVFGKSRIPVGTC